jgi:signal transduction histidine kinase
MEQALDRADQVLADGRDRVTELRDATYQSPPLPEALRIVGDDLGRDHAAEFSLSVEGAPRDLHPIVREESYRVAAEAITNAYRHAHARHIAVHIEFGKGGLSVRVADDGHGFDARQPVPATPSGHWGLMGMRERAVRIRGQLEISSNAATGSIVALHIPARRAYAEGPGGWGKLRQAWNRILGKE